MLLVRDKRQILSDWVRSERQKRNWSQSDLADRMGKVRAVINKIESGSNDPTLSTLDSLAKAFGYPITIILNVIGYDVNIKDENDEWVEAMSHKMKILAHGKRGMAEKILDVLLVDSQPVTIGKKSHAKICYKL